MRLSLKYTAKFVVTMSKNVYQNKHIAILTKHHKEVIMHHHIAMPLSLTLQHTSEFDTDTLGTFTRDMNRTLSFEQTAMKKSRLACRFTGAEFGLGSEGSFGPGPYGQLVPWHSELISFYDQQHNTYILGFAGGPSFHHSMSASSFDEVLEFANRHEFPHQHLVLRADDEHCLPYTKGIRNFDNLKREFEKYLNLSEHQQVFVELDLRAHASPKRRIVIIQACADLLEKLNTFCPHCAMPGFAKAKPIKGLKCIECELPTQAPLGHLMVCPYCSHSEELIDYPSTHADPAICHFCNP